MSRIKKKLSENMKKKLFGIAALCVLLASAPFLTSGKTESFKAVPAMNVSESGKKNAGTAGQAAALYRDEYTDETLKAIIIILNSNNKAGAGFRKKSIAKTEFIKTQKNGKKI